VLLYWWFLAIFALFLLVIGALHGAVCAWLYNLAGWLSGGVRITLS